MSKAPVEPAADLCEMKNYSNNPRIEILFCILLERLALLRKSPDHLLV